MQTVLQQILTRYRNEREVVIWGEPTRMLRRELRELGIEFRVAFSSIDVTRHYVVAVTEDDYTDFLLDDQSKALQHIIDYHFYGDVGVELPFDWQCYGTQVGKQTYFGQGVQSACREGYVKIIGRFTSINGTAKIHVDHQFNMTFVSDELSKLFKPEHQELFAQLLTDDLKLPHTENKSQPLTIGSDVWIGAHAFINCSKVKTIGNGAIIGSGAVVIDDVLPYAIVVGVPAKVKRFRYTPEQIEVLMRVRWWDWDETTIRDNAELLMYPDRFFKRFGTD
jgi:aminocyclitol acetyltransferase